MGKSPDASIDEALGREICVREHVKGLITGGISNVGSQHVLSAQLIDPQTGSVVRSYLERTKSPDQVIAALGVMAAKIRRDLGESLASIRQNDEPLPLVTTPSLEALKLFSEGNYLWRKGAYDAAVKAWETALQDDPDFAMAHAALGDAYMSHIFSHFAKGRKEYQSALLHAERITTRERLYIQASSEQGLGHVSEAVKDYRLYLNAYPDDAKARLDFGQRRLFERDELCGPAAPGRALGVQGSSPWRFLERASVDRPGYVFVADGPNDGSSVRLCQGFRA
jgi:tetratricopeptide (TPR) repeat protein